MLLAIRLNKSSWIVEYGFSVACCSHHWKMPAFHITWDILRFRHSGIAFTCNRKETLDCYHTYAWSMYLEIFDRVEPIILKCSDCDNVSTNFVHIQKAAPVSWAPRDMNMHSFSLVYKRCFSNKMLSNDTIHNYINRLDIA